MKQKAIVTQYNTIERALEHHRSAQMYYVAILSPFKSTE